MRRSAVATKPITFNAPDLDAKMMWRRLRAILWTLLCAFAAGVFLQIIPVPEFLAGMIGWVYFAALTVFFWPYFAKRWQV